MRAADGVHLERAGGDIVADEVVRSCARCRHLELDATARLGPAVRRRDRHGPRRASSFAMRAVSRVRARRSHSRASRGPDAEEDLAERYAPVVRLVEQDGGVRARRALRAERHRRRPRRGHGLAPRPLEEQRPRQDRAARRATSGGASTSTTSTSPATRSSPGCDYERWARRVTADTEPTVYAHVATEPGLSRTGSRSSTGSTTPSTTGTTCTRATGR